MQITKTQKNIPNLNTRQINAEHWAITLGSYLTNREKHIASAYNVKKEESNDITEFSFIQVVNQVVLFALASELEAGHTVITLNENDWQNRLIEPLLDSFMDSSINDTSLLESLLAMDAHVLANELTINLPSDTNLIELREKIATRIHLAQKFNKGLNQYVINSLSKFIKIINKPINNKSKNIFCFQYDKNQNFLTLWLHRTWYAEHTLAQSLVEISEQPVEPLPLKLDTKLITEQRQAIEVANHHAFSLITGGPGTGKTFTVAQLVMALHQQEGEGRDEDNSHLALVAPTGKASQRMYESLQNALADAGITMPLPEAKTIHRLLGMGRDGIPRYNADNPLSEDIIIVDEASMLGVELASKLVQAVKKGARLILLGDAHQLSAVDAGAVLADLCRTPRLQRYHQALIESRRFTAESGVGQLANLINSSFVDSPVAKSSINTTSDDMNGEEQSALKVLQIIDNHPDLAFTDVSQTPQIKIINQLQQGYLNYVSLSNELYTSFSRMDGMEIGASDQLQQLFQIYGQFRILCASHHGRMGVSQINASLTAWHQNQSHRPITGNDWYHGRPIMVQQNTYELGVFNGDVGICLQTKHGMQVFFDNQFNGQSDGKNKAQGMGISVNQLSDDLIKTAYAMTIHKSQGSEFTKVAVCFDDSQIRLLSRELIYTAVTRAKKQVDIYSTATALDHAIITLTVRRTGLGLQFEEF